MDENLWLVEQANRRKNKKIVIISIIILLILGVIIFLFIKYSNFIRLSNNSSDPNNYSEEKSPVAINFVMKIKSVRSDKGFLDQTDEEFNKKINLTLMDKKTETQLVNFEGNFKKDFKLESIFPKQFIELNLTNLNESYTLDTITLINKNNKNSEDVRFDKISQGKYKSNTFVVLTDNSYEVQLIFKSFISISGQIFLDKNLNGILDLGEIGIGKRIVSVQDSDGNILSSGFTLEDGSYELEVGNSGIYTIRVDGDGSYIPKEIIDSNLKYDDFLVSYKQSDPFTITNEKKIENVNLGLVVFSNEIKERLFKGDR